MPLWAVLLAIWVIAVPALVVATATVRAIWLERRDEQSAAPVRDRSLHFP